MAIPANDDDLPDNESAFIAGVRWAEEQFIEVGKNIYRA